MNDNAPAHRDMTGAPRDGTMIDVIDRTGRQHRMRWDRVQEEWQGWINWCDEQEPYWLPDGRLAAWIPAEESAS